MTNQYLGEDSMGDMVRQIMTLFDEYPSKENAKHTLRAMKENARQGYWNVALPPIGGTICVRSRNASRSSIRAKSASSARKPNCSGHLSPPRA